MKKSRPYAVIVAGALVLLPALVFAGDGKRILKYSVSTDGERIGWSKAVIDETGEGMVVTIGMKAEMELFGKPMEMSSTIKQEFDADGKLVSFSSLKDGPKGKSKMSGELRDDGGYEITRKEKGKTEKVTVSPDEYDFHSSDPRMYAGKVGSKNKYTVLALGAGEVRKVTVKILGRETREIGGKQVEVTHFVAKGMDGSMEEWRMDDGVLLKSKIKTPIGKIIVELEEP